MAQVRIEQRNGRLAADVRVESVDTREGPLAKTTLAVISNGYRNGESEPTLVRWTLWGKQAENAGKYLAKGSRVNVVGVLRNNNYDRKGETVYGFNFTAEEVDYLDSRGSLEPLGTDAFQQPAQREDPSQPEQAVQKAPAAAASKGRKGRSRAPATTAAYGDADVPF
jgi:single-strand DNA-binding protein